MWYNQPVVWLQHVGLVCSDLEKSVKFYTENFGLPKIREAELPASEMKILFGVPLRAKVISLKAEGQIIELFNFYDRPAPSLNPAGNLGISHFALLVGPRKEFAEKLKAKGVELIYLDRGGGQAVYFARDPDGILIELRE